MLQHVSVFVHHLHSHAFMDYLFVEGLKEDLEKQRGVELDGKTLKLTALTYTGGMWLMVRYAVMLKQSQGNTEIFQCNCELQMSFCTCSL